MENKEYISSSNNIPVNFFTKKPEKIRRNPMPLSAGLGFGATRIKEYSLNLARQAEENKKNKMHNLLNQNIKMKSEIKQTANTNNIVNNENIKINDNHKLLNKSNLKFQKNKQTKKYTNNTELSSLKKKYILLGTFLDFIIFSSLSMIFFTISYIFVKPLIYPVYNINFVLFTQYINISTITLQNIFISLSFIFLLQLCFIFLFKNTLGFYAVGIKILPSNKILFCLNAVIVALLNVLSFGGTLLLLINIFSNKRLISFPWIKLIQTLEPI